MIWLWDNAVTLGTVVMAIAAVAALIYAHLQIADSRNAEHLANANELWRETLRLAFDNPKLSDPTLRLADFDYDNQQTWSAFDLDENFPVPLLGEVGRVLMAVLLAAAALAVFVRRSC